MSTVPASCDRSSSGWRGPPPETVRRGAGSGSSPRRRLPAADGSRVPIEKVASTRSSVSSASPNHTRPSAGSMRTSPAAGSCAHAPPPPGSIREGRRSARPRAGSAPARRRTAARAGSTGAPRHRRSIDVGGVVRGPPDGERLGHIRRLGEMRDVGLDFREGACRSRAGRTGSAARLTGRERGASAG